jgi:predicted nucleic-acid-binding protein
VIGLDTNILVRYITQDEPRQSAIVTRLIETRCTRDAPGFVAQIVLCELTWILSRAYGYPKAQLVGLLEQLLMTAELQIEGEELAWKALAAWRNGPADFSNYLLVLGHLANGCERTYSFDAKLAKHPQVSIPK